MGVLGENYTKEAFFTLGLINEYIYIYYGCKNGD